MKMILCLVLALAIVLAGCGKKQPDAKVAPTHETTAGENPLTAPVDYLGAVNQAHKSAVKTVDLVSVRQAIQMFYSMEERYPNDLNELVTKRYIGRIPALPAGMKYQYDPRSGQLMVVRQ